MNTITNLKMKNKYIKEFFLSQISTFIIQIELLFQVIKESDDIYEINTAFDILRDMHGILSIIIYREEIEQSNKKIINFLFDCERIDDERFRSYLLVKIKDGTYNLECSL